MLFEFGLLYVLRVLAELRKNNSLRPVLSDGPASINYGRREDEEDKSYIDWVNPDVSRQSLCL